MGVICFLVMFVTIFTGQSFWNRKDLKKTDRYGISTKRDRILAIVMIALAVFSNVIAIYSDAYALLKNGQATRE